MTKISLAQQIEEVKRELKLRESVFRSPNAPAVKREAEINWG
jgi:hypothetical protein